ncbi:MAG: glycoside hydrolase family 2 protein [Oscillospiraceae bacterium]|nr:glycoside hydrolase family 2 protein [Oscillospiraceae bacterium]
MRIYLNRDWHFTRRFSSELLEPDCGGLRTEIVTIPHTCQQTPFHYFDENAYQMVSGYRKDLDVPAEWAGRQVLLTFEGVAHDCEVFLNGRSAGRHHCGYTAFTVKLENLRCGQKNSIAVKVDSRETLNVPPFGHVIDYMTYGGIYRDVYLEVKERVYLEDLFLHTDLKTLTAEVTLNADSQTHQCRISMKKKGTAEFTVLGKARLKGRKTLCRAKLPAVDLWDLEHPNLYDIKIELLRDDAVQDEKTVSFGFRTVEFRRDGFYLNGAKVKVRGLNRHQSYPYVGYAMPASMQRLDADILKFELGLNAVRTSHYPQSQAFIDRCDEIGLLVFTEMPGWQYIGDTSWKEQACQNVQDMVKQYRNHPSVMLWGVRINESPDDDAFYTRTNAIAHALDPTRPTGGVRNIRKGHFQEDVYTYNDFSHDGTNPGCAPKAHISPDVERAYMVTEYNGHMFPTKAFDSEPHRTQHALRHAEVLRAVESHDDIAGSFGWCMADYNTHRDFGSGDRICYHGVLDMFRNPKMAAAVYAARQDAIPVLETSCGMEIGEYPASTLGTGCIFTNADSVRMYRNGKFIKEFKNHHRHPIEVDDLVGELLMTEEGFPKDQSDAVKSIMNSVAKYGLGHIPVSAMVRIPKLLIKYKMTVQQVTDLYTKYIGNWGENAAAYRFDAIKNGGVVKSITKAPMSRMLLEAVADHTALTEDHTYDVALVRIRMVSEYGNVLSFANEPVFLETTGPIGIIGPKCIALQGGMFGTYVRSTGIGNAVLRISDTRGNEKTIHFQVTKAEDDHG